MSKSTRATLALNKVGVKFTLHNYDYDPDAERIGLQAAEAIGAEPRRVLKTLMAEVDGKPVCVEVPSDGEVSMKKLARVLRRKSACRPRSNRRHSARPACSSTAASAGCRSRSIRMRPARRCRQSLRMSWL